MLNDLYDPATAIRVSGHETFALRLLWLKKSFDAASGPDGIDRRTFQEQSAIAAFGVGKNMALSMRHWALATKVLEDSSTHLRVSDLGRLIFTDGTGLDPYLEHPSTLWLMHAHLVSEPQAATTFYYAFNVLNQVAFARDDLVRAMAAIVDARTTARATAETLKRDVEVFVRSYAPRHSDSGEDAAEPLLVELGLLREHRSTGQLEFVRGQKPSLEDSIFALVLKRFWERQHPSAPTISVEQTQYGPGSPGRVFKLDEDSLVARLMGIGEATGGKMIWTDTAGLRQVALNGRLDAIDEFGLIKAGYRGQRAA
ncbi:MULTISPECIES: DUF4007 family protein [unclassified Mesorhizobium]|uniref:DUF4007 family protein n=1 Tax=unclassified Mesorhizobium TaxID=325217 RepID=UPI000FCC250A|nr:MULTISPECIES: DUF4007 family protein [unclassified Mesorhizobium]RUV92680.1 DUF4007 family protein [Mesorhizobium sp. M1A.F.Ca.IN.020.04.1.1]RUW04387.1 DUF4007 family protein [Mesorhizobium sp. M1A.F.Ca.IN.020.03.1.1]RWH18394.1 MAG: DUF4007 family protein [Mesorhizobium sp.]RWH40295.1 MAG: DUF4007 family protein [Mesorhizobium sp.]TIR57696.1 MAG: DUF4007 family protein [Mesorhizobium sp.]